jgi:hypothetical protein
LIGLAKGLYKGNIPAWLLDLGLRYSLVMLGLAGGWLLYECALLLARLLGMAPPGSKAPKPQAPMPPPPEAAAA